MQSNVLTTIYAVAFFSYVYIHNRRVYLTHLYSLHYIIIAAVYVHIIYTTLSSVRDTVSDIPFMSPKANYVKTLLTPIHFFKCAPDNMNILHPANFLTRQYRMHCKL